MLKSYNCFIYFEADRRSVQKQETEEQTGESLWEQPFRNAYAAPVHWRLFDLFVKKVWVF